MTCDHCGVQALRDHAPGCPEIIAQLHAETIRLHAELGWENAHRINENERADGLLDELAEARATIERVRAWAVAGQHAAVLRILEGDTDD